VYVDLVWAVRWRTWILIGTIATAKVPTIGLTNVTLSGKYLLAMIGKSAKFDKRMNGATDPPTRHRPPQRCNPRYRPSRPPARLHPFRPNSKWDFYPHNQSHRAILLLRPLASRRDPQAPTQLHLPAARAAGKFRCPGVAEECCSIEAEYRLEQVHKRGGVECADCGKLSASAEWG